MSFVRRRYAKLVGILSERTDATTLNAVLQDLGSYCASTDARLAQFRGDMDGYRAHIKQTASGDEVAFDQGQGVITVTSPKRRDCFCPLISVADHTPQVVCNCSLGWQRDTWETVTKERVQVELKESVLRGGTRCVFQIRILKEDA